MANPLTAWKADPLAAGSAIVTILMFIGYLADRGWRLPTSGPDPWLLGMTLSALVLAVSVWLKSRRIRKKLQAELLESKKRETPAFPILSGVAQQFLGGPADGAAKARIHLIEKMSNHLTSLPSIRKELDAIHSSIMKAAIPRAPMHTFFHALGAVFSAVAWRGYEDFMAGQSALPPQISEERYRLLAEWYWQANAHTAWFHLLLTEMLRNDDAATLAVPRQRLNELKAEYERFDTAGSRLKDEIGLKMELIDIIES